MPSTTLSIDPRFRGPPASGNGGYSAGLLANHLGGSDCEVTLRQPPPLDADLRVEQGDDGFRLVGEGGLIATARRAVIDLHVAAPPSLDEAEAASRSFAGFHHHIFPGCFVCGPDRGEGDGLRIFPGKMDDGRVAAPWQPDPSLGDSESCIRSEHLWAALDCPGYFAVEGDSGPALLGRIAARIHERPPVGEPLIVSGWALGSDGRKHGAGTAIHGADGRLVAFARSVWVSVTVSPFQSQPA